MLFIGVVSHKRRNLLRGIRLADFVGRVTVMVQKFHTQRSVPLIAKFRMQRVKPHIRKSGNHSLAIIDSGKTLSGSYSIVAGESPGFVEAERTRHATLEPCHIASRLQSAHKVGRHIRQRHTSSAA